MAPSPNGLGSPKKKSQEGFIKGQKGLTGYAKRMIRNGCHVLEELCPPSTLTFFTATLPGNTAAENAIALEKWSELTRQFYQQLHRELDRAGCFPGWVGVTEIHPQRFKRTGQAWPHLHVVFQARESRYRPWTINKTRLAEMWRNVCETLLGEHPTKYEFATRVDACKGNPGRYMSKYLSKGGKCEESKAGPYPVWSASHWWSMANSFKRLVQARIVHVPASSARYLFRLCAATLRAETKSKSVQIWVALSDGEGRDCGYVGALAPPLLALMEDKSKMEIANNG